MCMMRMTNARCDLTAGAIGAHSCPVSVLSRAGHCGCGRPGAGGGGPDRDSGCGKSGAGGEWHS
jgi:hypothetical protein